MNINETTAVNPWISVKDRLPEESGEVVTMTLSTDGESVVNVMSVSYSAKWKAFNTHDFFEEEKVRKYETHPDYWMPMPEPPKEG